MADIVEQDGTVKIGNVTVQSSGEVSGAASFQHVGPDLTLTATAGKGGGDTAFFASVMGNIFGANLSKAGNYLGALIGHFNLTGTRASTYPAGAVLAGIGDGSTHADGAVVAYIDGDGSQTNCGAMFKVRTNNSTAASGPDYGIDLQDAAHDGYQPVDAAFYKAAPVRIVSDVVFLIGAANPTNGTTGANVAGPGSLYFATTTPKLFINTNTKASPTWTVVGSQS